MRLIFLLILFLSFFFKGFSQPIQTIEVHFYENYPFCYTADNGSVIGLEADILVEFTEWLKVRTGIVPNLKFKGYSSFNEMYKAVQNSENPYTIGAGTVSIAEYRRNEISFSAPYMRNRALVISNGDVPTVNYIENAHEVFAGKKGAVIEGTIHEKFMTQIKADHLPDLEIVYLNTPDEIIKKVSSNNQYIGMVDLVSYWNTLPQLTDGYVKIQRVFVTEDDFFGYIFPEPGTLRSLINEFLEAGFGFTSTRTYGRILSKHLGEEIIRFVEIDQF